MSRSAGTHKWLILYAVSTLWIASFYCILCTSALEHDMITEFNLSNTQFAAFATISFAFAIISAAFTPYIISQINLYNTMLLSSTLLTIGQTLFIVGILSSNLYIMYLGRVFIGFGYGFDNVTVYSAINIWFGDSEWLPFALNVVNSTFEIGILATRYGMQPLYNISQQIFVPYLWGIAFGLIAISSCIMMISIERNFLRQCKSNRKDALSTSDILDNDFKKIKDFDASVWLILLIIIIGWSSDDIFFTQITLPFMQIFNVTELSANTVLSVSSIYSLTIGQIWGWLISKYGFVSYWSISAMFLTSCSMTLLFFYDSNIWINNIVSPLFSMWIIVIINDTGLQYFYAASFTCLYMVCPLELTAIVNTVSCVGYMSGSALGSYLFGAIADQTDTYRWSIFMIAVLLIGGLIISIAVHVIDVKQNGLLHKKANSSTLSSLQDEEDEQKNDIPTPNDVEMEHLI
eukprot:176914_1